jgi:lysophospholipase L1-like esterase
MSTLVQMFPPSNGSRNSVTVSGRTYTGFPNQSTPVAASDVPAMQANGWTTGAANVATQAETWAAKLRRLGTAARAPGGNIFDIPRASQLIGAVPWTAGTVVVATATATQNLTGANFGATQVNDGYGNVYECVFGGTTGATTPFTAPASNTARPFSVIDNTSVVWQYIGRQTAPQITFSSSTQGYANKVVLNGTYPVDGDIPIRFGNGLPTQLNVTGTNYTFGISASDGTHDPLGTPLVVSGGNANYTNFQFPGYSIEFLFDGSKVELQIYPNAWPLLIEIDGIPLIAPINMTGGGAFMLIDFTNIQNNKNWSVIEGGRVSRRIKITSGQLNLWTQIAWEPTGNITYPYNADNFALAVVGDSQSVRYANTYSGLDTYPVIAQRLLGLPDAVCSGWPSTGFTASAGITNNTYLGRAILGTNGLNGDLIIHNAYRPINYIVVQGSTNDNNDSTGAQNGGQAPTAVQAAALTFFQAVRTYFPTIPIFVTGVLVAGGRPASAAQIANENAVAAAVAQRAASGDELIFFFPISTAANNAAPFFTGTGNEGAPTGSGNSDWDVGTDGVHLNTRGHYVYANWLKDQILAIANEYP